MPSVAPFSTRWRRGLRVCALLLSGASLIALAVPGLIEAAAGGRGGLGRQPDLSIRVAQAVCAASALLFAVVALALPVLERWATSWHRFWSGLRTDRFIWCLIGLSLLVRLPITPLSARPVSGDTFWYHETAFALARGSGLSFDGAPTAYRPPGYSFLLSLTYRLFGPYPGLAWVWGTLATALLLFSVHRAATFLYGTGVARLATVGVAVYPALVLLTGQPLSDLVFTAGLTAILGCALAGGARSVSTSLLLGLALGSLALVRSVGIVAAVPTLLVVVARCNERKRALVALPFLVGLALPLGLWTHRNHACFGHYALDSNAGFNLLVGNHPNASGSYASDAASSAFTAPAGLDEVEIDRVFAARALSFIQEEPGQWLASWPKKLVHLFALETSAARGVFSEDSRAFTLKCGLYALCQLSYTGLLMLFGVRLLSFTDRARRPRGLQALGLGVGAMVACVALITFGMDRYRLPFMPWMIIEAAVAYCGFCNSRAGGGPDPLADAQGTAEPSS